MECRIAIIRTKNISAKIIHLGGLVESLIRLKKSEKIYNHTEVIIGDITTGAIDSGVKSRNWLVYWHKVQPAEKIEYLIDMNESEKKKAYSFIDEYQDVKYEYSMFLFHGIKIFWNKWFGSKSNKSFFCYEFMIKFLNCTKGYNIDPYLSPSEFKKWADNNLKKKTQKL